MTHAHSSLPALLAHRGYRLRFPENTREGLLAAIASGAKNIEFDVQLAGDGVPVVVHDDSLDRTAGISKRISALSARELQGVEVAERDRLGDSGAGIYLPTLVDVAEDLQRFPEVTAFVELKQESMTEFGVQEMVERVLDVLREVLDQCVIISFSIESLRVVRKILPHQPVGWVLIEWSAASLALAEELGPEFLLVNYKRLPADEAPWPGDWRWVCYEIVDPDRAMELHGRGFDMISTFDIVGLLQAFGGGDTVT